MKKIVSTSGASLRFVCAICISDSKSLTARRPRTKVRPAAPGSLHGETLEGGHLDAPGGLSEGLVDRLAQRGQALPGIQQRRLPGGGQKRHHDALEDAAPPSQRAPGPGSRCSAATSVALS